jgi:hypothetical protein
MIDTYSEERPQENNECGFCGEPCERHFCNRDCEKGYEGDN